MFATCLQYSVPVSSVKISKLSSPGIFLASSKFLFSIASTEYLSSFFEKIDEVVLFESVSDLFEFDEHPVAVTNKSMIHIIVNNFFFIIF